MYKLYTISDFKFGEVGILFNGNQTLLSKIIETTGIRSQRTEFLPGYGDKKYIHVDVKKGIVINSNRPKKDIRYVPEHEVYFIDSDRKKVVNIDLNELIEYLYSTKYRGMYVAALKRYACKILHKQGLSLPKISDTLNLANHTHALYYLNKYNEPYWYMDFLYKANDFIRHNKIPKRKHNGGL
jgi:hypothetical protein